MPNKKRDSTQLETDGGAPMSRLFLAMGPEQSEAVVFEALSFRNDASESARSSLNAAIDNNVKMEKFRKPSRADASLLKDPTLYELIVRSNDKVAGALFRTWVESRADLRALVEGALADIDIPVDTPDFKSGRFNAKWDVGEFRKAREAVKSAGGKPNEDETSLMMMCLSGKSREVADGPDDLASDMLGGWIREMETLPPDAPEWEEAQAFMDIMKELKSRKDEERNEYEAASIDEIVAATKAEYDEELGYLEVDLSAWTGANAVEKNAATDAKHLADCLRELLSEYRPLHSRGTTKAEEADRGPKRDEKEKAILSHVKQWDELEGPPLPPERGGEGAEDLIEPGARMFTEMARIRKMETKFNDMRKASDEAAASQKNQEELKRAQDSEKEAKAQMERLESDNSDLKRFNADLKSQNDGIADENARLKRANAELEAKVQTEAESPARESAAAAALEAEVSRLGEDNRRLAQDNEGLRFDKDLLAEENDKLRTDLARSGESEEYWRSAYVAVSAGQSRAAMGLSASGDPDTVNEALDLAQSMFPNELAIALNSKSSKNSPFRKPDETLAALSWLATEYRRRRTTPSESRPDFNKLLKESCPGWFYKPGQTEVTAEQFIEWYTTSVDGKTHRLYHHIGKGNSHDPQNTIRIAFSWDDESQRVIVGFLGLHQRNRRS